MSMRYIRPLSSVTLSPGVAIDLASALDLGDSAELQIVLTVTQAGDGDTPVLVVKHAAVNEASAYFDFDTPVKISLSSPGTAWFKVDSFTRWICWFVSGSLNSGAVATIDIIAKN